MARLISKTIVALAFAELAMALQMPLAQQGNGLGSTAILGEDGIRQVALLKDHTQMSVFILRLIEKGGFEVKAGHMDDLNGLVPWYSGTLASQSFENLKIELAKAKWLMKAGHERVLQGADRKQKDFVAEEKAAKLDHVAKANEKEARDEAIIKTMHPDLNTSSRTAHRLAEVDKDKLGSTAILSEVGYRAVLNTRNKEQMYDFAMRVVEHHGLKVKDTKHFVEMLKYYNGDCATQSYGNLLGDLRRGVRDHTCLKAWAEKAPVEKHSGDHSLLQLGVEREANTSCSLPTWQWNAFSTQFSFLQAGVGASWRQAEAGTGSLGRTADLDEEGYRSVAAAQRNDAMRAFVLRAAASEGLTITGEESLMSMVPFYSGVCARQSYKTLTKELNLAVVKPTECGGPWVKVVKGPF